jgi:transposase-like protein
MCDATNRIFHDEDAAREYLEGQRWADGVYCPVCGQLDTVKKLGGKSMGKGWYNCTSCRRKFTVRVGTLYERSHVPLHKWLYATHLLCASKKGMSAHQLHRMLGVTYKTAWFMAHRIREGMKPTTNKGPMGAAGQHVEADETYSVRPSVPTAPISSAIRAARPPRASFARKPRPSHWSSAAAVPAPTS